GYTFKLGDGVPPMLQGATGDTTLFAERLSSDVREGRKVLALVKQDGNWESEPLDLTDVAFAPFCQEVTGESLEELVLIFVNAQHRENKPFFAVPQGIAPRLFTTNIGCGKWQGTAEFQQTISDGGDVQTSVVEIESIEFKRPGLTLEQLAAGEGQVLFGDMILPPNAIPGLAPGTAIYQLTDFHASWRFNEQYTQGASTACMGAGSGVMTEADVFSAIFDAPPFLRGTIAGNIPSLYRSFFTQIALFPQGEPVSGECVTNGQVTPYTRGFAAAVAGGYRNTPTFGTLLIESSGDRINQMWSVDEADMELDVSSAHVP
ncbi:MAG: hypothetical protein JRG70_16380, partial [Deltaproteobacteria bacterium]|nr:hypothetical protein [Deltaproteobacteria bacterium]